MKAEKHLYRLFEATILIKGIFAIIDIATAVLLFVFGTGPITRFTIFITRGEFAEDHYDLFARFLVHALGHLPGHVSVFLVLYFLIHGVINSIFVIGLWKEKKWAYPFAITAISVFTVYQLYRLSHLFSLWLVVLIVFDLITILLIWHEYHQRYKLRAAP
ncbi:MAG: DUF2127 domain-containing protein [Patescibacteria group bacterium]